MIALEEAYVSARVILQGFVVGGTLRLDFTKWTKRMSHATVWTSLGHEENFLSNSSKGEPVAMVMVF